MYESVKNFTFYILNFTLFGSKYRLFWQVHIENVKLFARLKKSYKSYLKKSLCAEDFQKRPSNLKPSVFFIAAVFFQTERNGFFGFQITPALER